MSEKLNKEMEEVVEEDTLEEASAPTVKGDAKSVKLKQQPENMQKPQGGPTASAPTAKGDAKSAKFSKVNIFFMTPFIIYVNAYNSYRLR